MIRSLRAIVVVILVAIMGVWSASTHAASAAGSGVGMPAYNYDSGPVGSASSRAHDERGPPVTAVDDCLHAVTTAPRFGGLVTRAYTYDHPERHVYTNIATLSGQAPPATVGQLVRKGDFVSGFVVAAKAVANTGIYVVPTAKGAYVGQSGNITGRLARHVSDKKFTQVEADAAERLAVGGGKTQREVAEQLKVDEMGGIDNLLNRVNPIGSRRFDLMPNQPYAR